MKYIKKGCFLDNLIKVCRILKTDSRIVTGLFFRFRKVFGDFLYFGNLFNQYAFYR